MATQSWLPRGFLLPDGSKSRKLLLSGDNWQIITTSIDNTILVVLSDMVEKWVSKGLIGEQLFVDVEVGQKSYCVFVTKHDYLIASVQQGPYPSTNIEAQAFAIALRETRKIDTDDSLHDAIYLEQISRLLPTYTLTERLDDQIVLGTWLSAGVHISISSFRRLCKLLEWMDANEVHKIIEESGLSVPCGNGPVKGKDSSFLPPEEQCDNKGLKGASLIDKDYFSLPGRPYLEAFFNENVVDIIKNEKKYRRMGIDFPSAIVLYGPPGCGKTFAVERLIEFIDWPSYSIDSGSIGSPYIHDTSKKIAEIFDKAIDNAPSVVVIDEMEAFLTDRSIGQSSGIHHTEEVAEFLRRIPEATNNHVLVIAMTNMVDSIDPAILRRGRFDHIVEVKMPSVEEVAALLQSLLSKLPVADNIQINELSLRLKERPLSDVAFVVKEAGRLAVKSRKDTIDQAMLTSACDLLPAVNGIHRQIGFTIEAENNP